MSLRGGQGGGRGMWVTGDGKHRWQMHPAGKCAHRSVPPCDYHQPPVRAAGPAVSVSGSCCTAAQLAHRPPSACCGAAQRGRSSQPWTRAWPTCPPPPPPSKPPRSASRSGTGESSRRGRCSPQGGGRTCGAHGWARGRDRLGGRGRGSRVKAGRGSPKAQRISAAGC